MPTCWPFSLAAPGIFGKKSSEGPGIPEAYSHTCLLLYGRENAVQITSVLANKPLLDSYSVNKLKGLMTNF